MSSTYVRLTSPRLATLIPTESRSNNYLTLLSVSLNSEFVSAYQRLAQVERNADTYQSVLFWMCG